MLLSALVAVSGSSHHLRGVVRALRLPPGTVRVERVPQAGVSAVRCRIASGASVRSFHPFVARLRRSRLPRGVKQQAHRILQRLAQAERRVHHGTAHAHRLYEVGHLDTLVSSAGCAWLLDALEVDAVYVGVLPLGYGWHQTAKGILPNPGPVVLELLRGWPVRFTKLPYELVTPTAAAMLTTIAQPLAAEPRAWRLLRIGYGAGTRSIPGLPGVVRACLMEATASVRSA